MLVTRVRLAVIQNLEQVHDLDTSTHGGAEELRWIPADAENTTRPTQLDQ